MKRKPEPKPALADRLRAAAVTLRPGRKCLTCNAEWREAAETLLREGMSQYVLSDVLRKELGVEISHSALSGHRRRCMGIVK